MAYIPVILNARVGADAITADKVLDGTLTDADVAAANKDGAVGVPSMRTIGTGALQAMAGNTTLDAIGAPVAAVDMNSQQFSNLPAATVAGQAVEFSQFDAAVNGRYFKAPADLATTGNIALTGEQTIDGTLTSASRVLVKDQTTASENGIYLTGAGAWTRTADADTGTELDDGATVWVKSGTVNGDALFTQTLTVTTIGTDNQSWAQTGSATSVSSFSDLTDGNLTSPLDGQLLRYESSTGELQNTTFAAINDAGRLNLSTSGSAGGLDINGAHIYEAGGGFVTLDPVSIGNVLSVTNRTKLVGVAHGYASVSANTLLDDQDHTILVDTSGGAVQITLPVAGVVAGTEYYIKRVGANNVTIACPNNIDGSGSPYTIDVNLMAVKAVYDGTDYWIY